ncbi:PWI domain mRNA processing protein [Penicillium chermesinum]|nr:PWI domain mRNA processing protein [Penicillium chermesinum]
MGDPVNAKLLKQMKFPPEFNLKVDMQKVNVEVMKIWIAGQIEKILGDDDIVIQLCFNLLEGTRFPDIKSMQIQLMGFLEKDTAAFCKELWGLCLSAQESPQGIPKELLEAKKDMLRKQQLEAEKAAEEARRRREEDDRRDREVAELRRRDREERGRGGRDERGWNSRGRQERGRRDSYSSRRRSQSPRGRGSDRFRDHPSRRDLDSYVPLKFLQKPPFPSPFLPIPTPLSWTT